MQRIDLLQRLPLLKSILKSRTFQPALMLITLFVTTGALSAPQRDPVIDRLTAEGVDIDAYLNEATPMLGMASTPVPIFTLQQAPSASHGASLVGKTSIPANLNDLT